VTVMPAAEPPPEESAARHSESGALVLSDVSKTFNGRRVLSNASLSLQPGEIHALVGQNGSGKSTLVKILSGFHVPDQGARGWVNGVPLELGSASAAQALGLRFVHQDLGVISSLTSTENLFLGRSYPRGLGGRIRWAEARRVAAKRLAEVGLDVDVHTPVGELEAAERAGVAIARATMDDATLAVLVLDEPTAFLPAADVDRLFRIVRRIAARGHAVLIISHHLDEVLEVSDRLTVLRDGHVVARVRTNEVDQATLARLIVGRDVRARDVERSAEVSERPVVLSVKALQGRTIDDFSVDVREGEIVGVGGLTGSGRESLASLINGRLKRTGGTVIATGSPVAPGSIKDILKAGVASISGDRTYGVFAGLKVRENLTVGNQDALTRFGWLSNRAERAETDDWIDDLSIVTTGPDALISSLSGGNQQKVIAARALRRKPRILVLDDPSAGIDVGSKAQIHEILAGRAEAGLAVLLVSTDSDELARLSDRVLVFCRGRITAQLRRGQDLTPENIDLAQLR
jgi:ribose transport system ATP-binding protein